MPPGLKRCSNGVKKRLTQVSEVIEKSDMDPQKVRNILFSLTKLGKVERVSRGGYRWGQVSRASRKPPARSSITD